MTFYRRRLPHLYEIGRPVFLTWRLHDSLPPHRHFTSETMDSGRAFVAMDRLLDDTRSGAFRLKQPEIADMVVDAIHYNASALEHYELNAFVVMPNHVHLLATLKLPLPKLTKSLKSITAKRANEMLGLTGSQFWQKENYDRLVRDRQEFERIRSYIEQNPVRAGLVDLPSDYRWSSAGWSTRGSPANEGVRPT